MNEAFFDGPIDYEAIVGLRLNMKGRRSSSRRIARLVREEIARAILRGSGSE